EPLLVLIEIIIGLLLEVGALHLFGGAVALGDLYPVRYAPHIEMGDGRALARMDVLGLHDDAELAVDVEHVAFAHRACDNLDHRSSAAFLETKEPRARRKDGRLANQLALSTGVWCKRQGATRPLPLEPQQRPWWHPDVHADRRPFLAARSRIKAALGRWFEAQGFIEVETAALQVSPGNETHLHAFATELIGTDGARRPRYLATSPEFACKKLLA